MATFAMTHGGGDVGWYWHLVEAELRRPTTLWRRTSHATTTPPASTTTPTATTSAVYGCEVVVDTT